MHNRIDVWVSAFARKSVPIAAFTLGYGCSAPEEDLGGMQQADRILRSAQIVKVRRVGVITVANALDSQNALPSGILADRLERRRLEILARGNLIVGSPTLGTMSEPLVRYLARCALREDDTITVRGVAYDGRLGFVPNWKTRSTPLDGRERRWLTGCLMAHANDLGSVHIAVAARRGDLAAEAAEDAPTWSFEEAAFYGDVFAGSNSSLFACLGASSAARCDGEQVAADIARRICGSHAADCRFTFTGPCTGAAPPTCDNLLPYGGCAQRAYGSDVPVPFKEEVVSVFLRTSADMQSLHPYADCTQ